ncbi:MAG: XdhC family protein [Bacteroidota bacterium]
MLDIFDGIDKWVKEKIPFALVTVTATWGSGPRKVGQAMAVSADKRVLGSVSGGCVEDEVVAEALEVLTTGVPKQLNYGISHEEAWDVGLSCGGKLGLYVEPFLANRSNGDHSEVWSAIKRCVALNSGGVLLTRIDENDGGHTFITSEKTSIGTAIGEAMTEQASKAYLQRKNQLLEEEGIYYFAKVFHRHSELIVIGAAHMATDLITLANLFGFRTTVIEPRGFFNEKAEFPSPPDAMYKSWPEEVLPDIKFDQYTYAVTLSHDPRIDDQALHILLKSEVSYIGCLGSRRTHEKRVNRLKKAGFSEEDINRIHGPIGFNIKAKSGKEIALSIMAEIIAVKNQYL